MFRSPSYLEGKNFVKFDLNTPLTILGNGQTQRKDAHTFAVADRDNLYDWYNAYFGVEYTFEATANGAAVATDTQSAPINGSFSLIKQLTVKSTGKVIYTAGPQNPLYQELVGLFRRLCEKCGEKSVLVP